MQPPRYFLFRYMHRLHQAIAKPIFNFLKGLLGLVFQQVAPGDPIPDHLTGLSPEHQRYLKLASWSTQALAQFFLSLMFELQVVCFSLVIHRVYFF